MTPQRKPDHVFNVMASGNVLQHGETLELLAADFLRTHYNDSPSFKGRVAYRILVRMKPKPECQTERWLEERKPIGERLDNVVERSIESLRRDLSGEPKRQASYPEIPQGFIPHHGGPCPVAEGTRGRIIFENDTRYYSHDDISLFDWEKTTKRPRVIAYRIERDPSFKVEAGRYYIDAEGKRRGPLFVCNQLGDDLFVSPSGPVCIWTVDGFTAQFSDGKRDLLALAADQTSPMVST